MRLTGAGVLAYTVHRGEILVLLGRERETPGWKQGSHKWSSFSGKVEANEKPIQGAAREFAEEACACVPIGGQQIPARVSEVEEMLRRHARPVEQTTLARGERLVYFTYIVRVPYAPYDEDFCRTRERLLELDGVFRNFYRLKKLADAAPRFFFPGFVLSAHITVVDFRVLSDTEVEVRMHEEGVSAELVSVFSISAETVAPLRALQAAWEDLQDFIRARSHDPIFSHPAVNIVTSRKCIVNAFVNKAYLEKCEIKWWKLSDLLRFLEQPWLHHESVFRKLFLENLATLAKHIMLVEETHGGVPLQGQSTGTGADEE
jgi:8-oxo-dGTP pyrophosphatase MutT (NUDIX family)